MKTPNHPRAASSLAVKLLLAFIVPMIVGAATQPNLVISKGEHNHGYGGCLGEITVSESMLTFKVTKRVGDDHSFSAPLRNIVKYKFIDNAAGKDPQRAHALILELNEWSSEGGTKGNPGLTLIFEDRSAFNRAHTLFDAAHNSK